MMRTIAVRVARMRMMMGRRRVKGRGEGREEGRKAGELKGDLFTRCWACECPRWAYTRVTCPGGLCHTEVLPGNGTTLGR